MSTSVSSHTLPFVTRIAGRHAKDIIARDRARAQKIMQGINPHGPAASHELRRRSRGGGVDATDGAIAYTASVGVGTPPTQYTLIIDTGSANTWVGADKPYQQTSSSINTGRTVNVTYGSASLSGTEFIDTVTLSPSLVIEKQSIGVSSSAQGFEGVDGILGLGPSDLTFNTVSGKEIVPTVTDNLFAQGTIKHDTLGIFFAPTNENDPVSGELTFGGVDTRKITSDVSFVPITSKFPASFFWGIKQNVTYGSDTRLLHHAHGIVDTGTTLLLLATDAFQAYQEATGATMDSTTGLLTLTEDQFANLQSLYFHVGDGVFEFTPNAQIWPRALNTAIGGQEDQIFLITADMGSQTQGLDFINGFALLQRFYSVYDTANSRVGLATTEFTYAETN
ncbi:acid protease [Trametes punicea]|nr:acid protease [Trametes punicea]